MDEQTSMRISRKLLEKLKSKKVHPRQSFEEIIEGLLADKGYDYQDLQMAMKYGFKQAEKGINLEKASENFERLMNKK